MKNSVINLNKYDNRIQRVHQLGKSTSIYASETLGNLLTILFVLIDLSCLYTVWNGIQTENPVMIVLIAFGCAVCLDVPLAIAAHSFAEYKQGVSSKSKAVTILSISIAVFAIAFIFTLVFRIINKDIFEVSSSSGLVDTLNNESQTEVINAEDNRKTMIAALFTGVMPLLTSLSSFVVNYFSAKPLDKQILKLTKNKIHCERDIAELESVLEESETANEHCQALHAREKDIFESEKRALIAESYELKQLARIAVMKKINANPDAVTVISDDAKKLNENIEQDFSISPQLNQYLENLISEGGSLNESI